MIMATNDNVTLTAGAALEAVLPRIPLLTGMRRLFYVISPAETSHGKLEEVPDYVNEAIPFFMLLMVLEMVILHLQNRPLPRWSDSLSSISAGLFSQIIPLVFVRNIELSSYIWIYEHFSLYVLPWDCSMTWVLAFLGVDFGYYWVHRMAHEVNFMWAAHQAHHSSEDYNLSTALRQSALQKYSSWMFYLPMALFVPPSMFLVHIQFNLLYQYWIHTEVVRSLGPLEYILNTASHHRVHHGRNRYCIDKNYGGTLIIWDRMFGTFTPESDEVVYGLVHPLASWDPIYVQLCHWKYILQTAWTMDGFSNKVSVFWKGPGWEAGKPRTGLLTDIPDIHAPQPKYESALPLLGNLYCYLHLALTVTGHMLLAGQVKVGMTSWIAVFATLYLLWTLTNLGYLYEHRWYGPPLELLRCITVVALDAYICSADGATCPTSLYAIRGIFFLSAALMIVQCSRMSFRTEKVE